MANKTIETRPIEDTIECIEALAEIVKKNDLGKIRISNEDLEIVIEGKKCPPPAPGVPVPMRALRCSSGRRGVLLPRSCGCHCPCSGAGCPCG